ANKTPANLRKAQSRIQEMTRVALPDAARDTEGWDVPPDRLADGDPVMVESYGAKGVLLEDPKGKKRVRVRLGGMVTVVETQKLRGSSRPVQSRPAPQAKVTVEVESGSRPRNSCDLRGMRWEEAQSVVETFVNQAVVNRVGRIKIVHGHGMGALKKLVRDYLETSGLGKSYQPGTREEGGDGVTIVEL
ncbi:MAG: Smr/MutS family protein, partial [Nitrospinae bacterium]|nr:Smr/MutS family protein [Nitrospinota bacterium]